MSKATDISEALGRPEGIVAEGRPLMGWGWDEGAPNIHPSAVVSAKAEVHPTVRVGPHAVIGPGVVVGEGCTIGPHATLAGPLTMGRDNQVWPFASLGQLSQDRTSREADPTRVEIGDRNVFREYVSVQRGTMKEFETKGGVTRVGDDNLVMNYCHIAHDCWLGSRITMANNSSLAGHVMVGDNVVMGGFTLVYQFVRLGDFVFTTYSTAVTGDIPPFMLAQGAPAEPRMINKVGLSRAGFSRAEIQAIDQAFRLIYRAGKTLAEAEAELAARVAEAPVLARLHAFITDPAAKRALQR